MLRFQKKNNKSFRKTPLHASKMNHTPFDMRDTAYLEHLQKESKLRSAREGMLSLRKNIIESNKMVNYQNEMDRIKNELSRPNLPHDTKEHLEDRVKQMKNLIFA